MSKTVLRVALGAVMLPHGLQMTAGWFGGEGFRNALGGFTSMGFPIVLGFLAILAQSAGAAAIIAGFCTRVAAFGVGATMLVASNLHRTNGFFMNWSGAQRGEGVEFHILTVGMAVALVLGGAGAFSVDRLVYTSIKHQDRQ